MATRRETIELGSAPHAEACAQVGSEDYAERARKECATYRRQLRREAAAAGIALGAVELVIKSSAHDYGSYYEVAVRFDGESETECEAAYWLEGNQPERWDAEARVELGLEEEVDHGDEA